MRLFCALLGCLLTSCGGNNLALQQVTAETLMTPTATLLSVETPLPATPEGTAEVSFGLSVWLPETLAPTNNEAAALVLTSQIENFQASQPDITVSTRLKATEGIGSVMATLLSASNVAPGALPDLTLIRRQDLRAAVQAGLVQPLDGRVSSVITGDFYAKALQLGQLNGRLYGLSYALEIQHVAYLPPDADFTHFSDVLAGGRPLVIPAGRVNGISDVLLVQYVAAGGTVVNGNLGPLNANALKTVLEFYEQAAMAGVIDPGVLNYPTPEDYRAGLVDGRIKAAVVTSDMYLDLVTAGREIETAPIPVSSGSPRTMADGWLWVMTTKDAAHQGAALRFLEWMFDAGRHSTYTHAINRLPSTREAMRSWGSPVAYTEFADNLLTNAVLPLIDNEGSPTARAMQNALVAVLSGERTAAEATQDVVDQLAG
jgi:ABC-type glycerol-3-phosphate transport system substrate-binding protein